MMTRRECLQRMAGAGAMLAFDPRAGLAQAGRAGLITRAIPGTGERLPIVGLGSHAEQTILPLARDKGIAVLVYAPFGRTRLWARVKGRQVPEWAREAARKRMIELVEALP